MVFETVREIIAKLNTLITLTRQPESTGMNKIAGLRHLKFVDVIYDDWNGIKRPIGLIHEIKLPSGERREVFTFCCKGPRQPEMALFVRKRTGNLSEDMALTHDGQDMIPDFLKRLPDEYREPFFRPAQACAAA